MLYFYPRYKNTENKRSVYLLQLFLYDSTMIAPFPLLFFGGDISVFMEEGYETVAVDDFIKFKSPTRIANLVKVCVVIRISPDKVNYWTMTYGLFHKCHKERITELSALLWVKGGRLKGLCRRETLCVRLCLLIRAAQILTQLCRHDKSREISWGNFMSQWLRRLGRKNPRNIAGEDHWQCAINLRVHGCATCPITKIKTGLAIHVSCSCIEESNHQRHFFLFVRTQLLCVFATLPCYTSLREYCLWFCPRYTSL